MEGPLQKKKKLPAGLEAEGSIKGRRAETKR